MGGSAPPPDENADLRHSLASPGDHVPLLGKQCLYPIDHCAHAGGAAQVTVDDDPVLSR
jgi:hypothetical protein